MNTRRDALRIFAATSAAMPTLVSAQETKEVETQPGHVHTGPAIKVPDPGKPTFFQPGEFTTIEAVSECIIPKTETPGAKEVGVALLIDKAIVTRPALMVTYRAGIADLNGLAISDYGKEFAALTEDQQLAVLTPLSLEDKSALGNFFSLVRNMTIDAYYATEAGLKTELGWHGNTYLPAFPGCDHPEHHS